MLAAALMAAAAIYKLVYVCVQALRVLWDFGTRKSAKKRL
jgi:hypothetical protein